MIAELLGQGEPEEFYCPALRISSPTTGAVSLRQSDCPPYDKRESFEKRWSGTIEVPQGRYLIVFEWLRSTGNGHYKLLARAELVLEGL